MKKRTMALGLLLILVLSISASAVNLRATTAIPSLTFSNGQANCVVSISANSNSEKIAATIKLWHGSSCVRTWTASDTGDLSFYETAPATRGETYKLSVAYTLNGKAQPTVSATNTY